MSEQNQSNLQALGAGLLGFVVVMAVGGGALMVHFSPQSKAAKHMAAAAPIDLGAGIPQSEPSLSRPQRERRAESPAPLIGDDDQSESSEAADASRGASAAPSPEADPSERARLKVDRHVEASGGSAIEASVKNSIGAEKAAEEKAVAKGKSVKKAALKLDPAAGANAVATVHYGVTSRSELMGRAAGPVYNVKGNAAVAGSGGRGKMAADVNSKVTNLKSQLEATGLSAEQRAALVKDLEAVTGVLDGSKAQ